MDTEANGPDEAGASRPEGDATGEDDRFDALPAPGEIPAESGVEPEEVPPSGRAPLRPVDRLVLALILAGYAFAVFARLGQPGKLLPDDDEQCRKWPVLEGASCFQMIPLDEVHYVPDARDVIRFGTESDTRVPTEDDGAYVVHPPVGKWFIALGMLVLGDRPVGWRAAGAAFGLAGVLLIYLIALRLWRSPLWAAFAALLLASDGLWFVQSRVAMLDVYAATFTLAGIWLVLEARERRGWRWWVLAGLAFGLTMASKWGPAPIVFVALILALRWGGWRALVTVALIPVVYASTYAPWFADASRYVPPACAGERSAGRFGQWFCYQQEMYRFHRDLEKYEPPEEKEQEGTNSPTSSHTRSATSTGASANGATSSPTGAGGVAVPRLVPAHPYFGHGYSWPWIGRPVAHYYETEGNRAREVLGLPNPVVWWLAFFVGLPVLLVMAVRRDALASVLVVLIGAAYLPYAVADAVARPVFLFYALPLVPLLVLGVVHVFVRAAGRSTQAGTVAVTLAMLALAAAIFFYPVLAAYPVPTDDGWRARMWLSSDCTVEDRIKIACWI